jgi:hypothetical protein
MPLQRTLDDAYRVQQEVVIDEGVLDDKNEPYPPFRVLVRKLSPIDQEVVLRKANAARAVVLAAARDQTSELYLDAYARVWDEASQREALLRIYLADEVLEQELSTQSEVEHAEGSEWGKDDYLQGLVDAWKSELSDTFAENPDDPDARRVFEELQRFWAEVRAIVDRWWEDQQAMHADMGDDELRDKVVGKVLEREAEKVWEREYQLGTVWRATRLHDNPRAYYWQGDDGLARVRDLEDEVFQRLLGTYRDMTVGVMEGKDSPGTPASSPSSEPPATGETSDSSGPVAASA